MPDRDIQQKILETMGIDAGLPNRNTANRQTRINSEMVGNRAKAITQEDVGDAYGGDSSLVYQSEQGMKQLGPDFFNLPFDKAMEAFGQDRNSTNMEDMRLSDLWNNGDGEVRERITEALLHGYGMNRSDDITDDVMDEEMQNFIERLDSPQ